MNTKRSEQLRAWIDALDVDGMAEDMARDAGTSDLAAIRRRVDRFANEAFTGLRLVDAALESQPSRILEIGSGGGFLARFLKSEGFDVTGVEPASDAGFSFMRTLDAAVATHAGVELTVLPIGADALDADAHGTFDLIYSLNVLEHVDDLDAAFSGMTRVLAAGGRMLHSCPNYRVPYEPHLALPLVPGRPEATRSVFTRRIDAQLDLWNGLNFVTAGTMQRIATRHGLRTRFHGGAMATTFERLRRDPIFRRRHPGPMATIANTPALGSLVTSVLRALPASWQTPMIVDLEASQS